MIHVYIAGPFRAPNRWAQERNVRRAEEVAFQVAGAGFVPVCPHSMYRNYDGTLTNKFWLEATMSLLKRCDAMVMVDGWHRSEGTLGELRYASSFNYPLAISATEWDTMQDARVFLREYLFCNLGTTARSIADYLEKRVWGISEFLELGPDVFKETYGKIRSGRMA